MKARNKRDRHPAKSSLTKGHGKTAMKQATVQESAMEKGMALEERGVNIGFTPSQENKASHASLEHETTLNDQIKVNERLLKTNETSNGNVSRDNTDENENRKALKEDNSDVITASKISNENSPKGAQEYDLSGNRTLDNELSLDSTIQDDKLMSAGSDLSKQVDRDNDIDDHPTSPQGGVQDALMQEDNIDTRL